MAKIKILDENVANIIAAGEVVENPAAMIKELVENSIDAMSDSISITVEDGGRYVKIKDNGEGMEKDDLLMSVERHATSKISKKEDIYNLQTYGFRGEALASIAAVAKVTMASRTETMNVANKVNIFAGVVRGLSEEAMNRGTEIEIRELFYNMPARLKFLKSKNTEYIKIKEIILREALVNFNTAFTLTIDGKEQIRTSGNGFENTVLELFGRNVLKSLVKFENGYAGDLTLNKANRDYLFTYFNGRFAKAAVVDRAIIDAYYTKLMKDRYPFVILFLSVPPNEIDVNIHPSKKVVKFSDERKIYEIVKMSILKIFEEDEKAISSPFIFSAEKILDTNLGEQTKIFDAETKYDAYKRDEKEAPVSPIFRFSDVINEPKEEYSCDKKDISNNTTWNASIPPVAREEAALGRSNLNSKTSADTDGPINTGKSEPLHEEKQYIGNYADYIEESEEKNVQEKNLHAKDENWNANEKNEEPKRKFKVIGQLHNMYILVENEDELEIYDQHVVHERILYEELKEKYYKNRVAKKLLLIPTKIELDRVEKSIVMKNIESLMNFGFDVEEFGDREVLIRSVPDFDIRVGVKELFYELISDLKNESGEIRDIREKIIVSMSCKGAVKAGERLSVAEMEVLIKKLHEKGKYTCPHGRPIIIKMGFDELEKKFKRKL